LKPVIIITIAFVLLIPINAYAIDYRDSTGYTPSWAIGQEYHYVLNECNYLIGDTSRDGNWCNEWVAYVLDQGVENFPQSTSENTKSIPNFTLEDGPLYSGSLTNLLPDKSNYGSDWQVGKPFTIENLAQMKSAGVTDFVSQRIAVPDEWDTTNFLKISYIITEFDNSNTSSQFYSKLKDEIYSQNYPTVSEYFELEEQGIYGDRIELEKSSEYFVADCIGQMINYLQENEEAKLTCIKENYIIAVMASWKTDLYNTSFTLGGIESTVNEYSEIIVNNIENNSTPETIESPSIEQVTPTQSALGNEEFMDIPDVNEPETTPSPTIEKSASNSEVTAGGGCLIATATYGSELAPQVQQLRELRDNQLLNTESGSTFLSAFNDFYYSFSPLIADYERENPMFREMVKIAITPMITSLSILNYVDMDSEVEVLGYGISLIILNGMMYVGIPAIIIMRIRRRNVVI